MEKYKKYRECYPDKTDAQIIESLAYELSDKVETIHQLLAENEALRKQNVNAQSEQFYCYSGDMQTKRCSEQCSDCRKDAIHEKRNFTPAEFGENLTRLFKRYFIQYLDDGMLRLTLTEIGSRKEVRLMFNAKNGELIRIN